MMKKLFLALLLVTVNSYTQVYAKDDCPMVSTQTVAEALAPNSVELQHADPSGMCSWMVEPSNAFSVQVLAQASSQEAKELYKVFETSNSGMLPKTVEHKTIGEASSFRMSGAGAGHITATLLTLNKARVVNISYYPREAADLNEKVTSAMLKIGKLATTNSATADQGFGSCEWLPESELDKLLGRKNRSVQRLGEDHCLASAQPGSAALTVMTDKVSTSRSFNNEKAGITKECKTVPLSEFGNKTYAFYDCENPGNRVMGVEFYHNGVHLKLDYKPAGRGATRDDLDRMKPLIKHVFTLLDKG